MVTQPQPNIVRVGPDDVRFARATAEQGWLWIVDCEGSVEKALKEDPARAADAEMETWAH